jgi:galactose-1-phosphate uridylyltransferase
VNIEKSGYKISRNGFLGKDSEAIIQSVHLESPSAVSYKGPTPMFQGSEQKTKLFHEDTEPMAQKEMFKKISSSARILNPFKGHTPEALPFEIRFDPLTGETGRVFHLPFKAEKPHIEETVKRSREIFCPFCPETLEKSTPAFPEDIIPEGRIKVGGATLFPNMVPFDQYAAVSVFSDEHFIAMEHLTPLMMRDAFLASLRFLKRIQEFDPKSGFFGINWNYMPPAGSSIVHPHLQPSASRVPTNQLRLQLDGAARYAEKHRRDYWADFLEAEKRSGERYIAEIGSTFWVMSFLPFGFLPDVTCVFAERHTLTDLTEDDLSPFLEGLAMVLRYFLEENVYSFNMALFAIRESKSFRVNARICPRLLPRPIGNSDVACPQMLHKESFTVYSPESVCAKVREVFENKNDVTL